MTTTFWNSNAGKSVPSGGANQLTTAAGNGTNTGNWLQASTNGNTRIGVSKLVIGAVILAIILFFILRRKKHGK